MSFIVGIVLLIPFVTHRFNLAAPAAFICVVASVMLTPGIWSALTTLNSSANQSLPAAYDGRSSGPANMGRSQVNEILLSYLEANTQGMKYLMAVPSSMQGSDYVLVTGRPVLYLGGFNGNDQVETSSSLAKLVADGELRFIYWDARGGGGPNAVQSNISAWITSSCKFVGFDTATLNFGAPDGTTGTTSNNTNGFARGGPDMQVSLYDCVGS